MKNTGGFQRLFEALLLSFIEESVIAYFKIIILVKISILSLYRIEL